RMHLRTLALSLAPLFAASLARAQAPGEVAPQIVVAPVVAPVVVAPTPTAAVVAPAPAVVPGNVICGGGGGESVMANRWAIGFSVGSMSLAPDAAPDDKTAFAVGELALRFRATPHLELE